MRLLSPWRRFISLPVKIASASRAAKADLVRHENAVSVELTTKHWLESIAQPGPNRPRR